MSRTITVNDNIIQWHEGMTVSDVLKAMNYSFKLLIVKINDNMIKREDFPTTEVPAGADVKVIHLMSGG